MAEQTMVERSGRAALDAADIGIRDGESYEDFDRRRSIAAGRAAIEEYEKAKAEERHEASPPKP